MSLDPVLLNIHHTTPTPTPTHTTPQHTNTTPTHTTPHHNTPTPTHTTPHPHQPTPHHTTTHPHYTNPHHTTPCFYEIHNIIPPSQFRSLKCFFPLYVSLTSKHIIIWKKMHMKLLNMQFSNLCHSLTLFMVTLKCDFAVQFNEQTLRYLAMNIISTKSLIEQI